MPLADDDVERHVDEPHLEVGRRPARVGLPEERGLREVLPARGTGFVHSRITPVSTWLWKFSPTPGRSTFVSIPYGRRFCVAPIPESAGACGDSIAPPQTITSRVARAVVSWPSFRYSTPTHRPFSRISRVACECVLEVRFSRYEHRIEVALLGRVPLAVLDVDVVPTDALHVRAVEVVGRREAQLDARVDERLRRRVRLVQARVRHVQRASLAAGRVRVVLLILQLLEVREALGEAPAGAAVVGPVVVVRGVAADVHHDVEVARPARHLPAGLVGRQAVEALLRDAQVAPVDRAAEERVPEGGVRDVLGISAAAGLEREHGDVGDLGEPGGDARSRPSRCRPR